MQEAQIKRQPAAEMAVCPYLGTREDRETLFAFPSMWNCCHLSKTVSPVSLELQRTQCLTGNYVRCPVFVGGEKVKLPADYRLKYPPEKGSRRFGALFLVLALLLGAAAWMAFSGEEVSSTAAGLWSEVRAAVPIFGGASPTAPAFTPAAATPSDVSTPALIVIQPSETPYPSQTASPASTEATTPVTICGVPLDAPIASGSYQFVIHKVSEGESMDLLETRFDTTTKAIQAANYFLPVPLWVDMVIVIPLGSADLANMPAFEPYYVAGASASLEALARNLSVTADALREYNGWNSDCQVYTGWILVPRERAAP